MGSEQYRKRLKQQGADQQDPPLPPHPAQTVHSTGRIAWDSSKVNFNHIKPSTSDRAVWRLQQSLPVLIWNAAALEGNTFTLPEVRTLLEGVTVGGKRQREAEQIIALSEAFTRLTDRLTAGNFTPSREISSELHALVARHEAIESGHFRGEGSVQGGGHVSLSTGSTISGDETGPNGELLQESFTQLEAALGQLADPRERALAYFCSATRSQFYFDGNKRTARLMMAGMLISEGFEAINIPYARILEFNLALDDMFASDNATRLMQFLADCARTPNESSAPGADTSTG